jgi:hypothetical protein
MLLCIIDAANKEQRMSKLFTVAGTSVLEGVLKFRVANGGAAARTKVLEKNGHTQINLVDLPKAMTKEDAMVFLNYTDGEPIAKPALKAKVEKTAPKVKAEKKVIEKEFKIPRNAPAETKTPDEIAAIKAKNLETMRAVTLKHKSLDALHKQVREEFAVIEAELEQITADDIPAMFRKECGFAE